VIMPPMVLKRQQTLFTYTLYLHILFFLFLFAHTRTHAHMHLRREDIVSIPRVALIRKVGRHTATHCNTLQHTATHCNTLQHTARPCKTLQDTARHCKTLQDTARHCNKTHHTATHCNTTHLRGEDIIIALRTALIREVGRHTLFDALVRGKVESKHCVPRALDQWRQTIRLFCKRALQKRLYSAKETYNLTLSYVAK